MTSDRLTALAHYLIWKCEPTKLGATKLNKVIWFADVEHYRSHGRSITGAMTYERQQFGPVPKGIVKALRSLEREGKIVVSEENYFGRPKRMFFSKVKPDLTIFSAGEIAIIDMVANAICDGHTAVSVSDASHDPLWQEIEMGADIPVGAAAVIPAEITTEDLEWAASAFEAA